MKDKMKCCFCGVELIGIGTLTCPNTGQCKCAGIKMPDFIWQSLIDGKKAQDALKVADNKVKIAETALFDIKNICIRNQALTYLEKARIWADANGALNGMAIESITKQGETSNDTRK